MITNTESPKLDAMQKVGDLGTFSPKGSISIKSFPSGLREVCGRKKNKNVTAKMYVGY